MKKTRRAVSVFGSALAVVGISGCTTQNYYPETPAAGAPAYQSQPYVAAEVAPPPPPPPTESVPAGYFEARTVDDFYEPLQPHGEWVVVASYGRCWRPARVEPGWRPYC